MFAKFCCHKLNEIRRHFFRKCQEPVQYALNFKGAFWVEEGRLFACTSPFAVINAMMRKSPVDFPADGVLFPVFVVSQLKCRWFPVLTHPYKEVLFFGKKPATGEFARNLLGISDFSQHFENL